MTRTPAALALFATLALAACDSPTPDEGDAITADPPAASATPGASPSASTPAPAPLAGEWEETASDEGNAIFFAISPDGSSRAHLFCPNGGDADQRFLVNIQGFDPVASEERMTVGSGGTVVTLVAAADPVRGGVSGKGPVPADIASILTGGEGVAVNYGSQNLGPLPTVPAEMAAGFARGCND